MNEIRKVSGLFVTECICFPRSGHHMLQSILTKYFDGQIGYCELYLDSPETRIENCPSTNFQKNHDFDLDTPIKDDRKYLVQIRDPIDALASRWELDTRTGMLPSSKEIYQVEMAKWAAYWSGFFAKWVIADVPSRLVVRYRDLLQHPVDSISHVIQFMRGRQNVDAEALQAAIEQFPPQPRRERTLRFVDFA